MYKYLKTKDLKTPRKEAGEENSDDEFGSEAGSEDPELEAFAD